MTLDEYLAQWERDSKLDLSTLDESARDIPYLHARWWKFYTHERLRLKKIDSEYKLLYRQKWEYFLGKLDDEERKRLGWPVQPLRILPGQVSVYLDSDEGLLALQNKKAYVEEILRFMEDVIKQINNRNYAIRSAIDFLKFKQGV